MLDWVSKNFIEIIGAVTGIIYLYFSVKQKIWLWPIGIISSAYYVVVFYRTQLYADMSLNIYYVMISVYGWFFWLMQKETKAEHVVRITVLSLKDWLVCLFVALTLFFIWGMALVHLPVKMGMLPSSVPWWDAFLTAGSIVATWMLARKILDQWLWWVVIDGLSVGVFIYKELYFTAGLFVVNTIMAVIGYIKWREDWKKQ